VLLHFAGVDGNGTFWMMSEVARKPAVGCSGAINCTVLQTIITRFASKVRKLLLHDLLSRPRQSL
jgi:hypothetical protein